MKRRSFVKTLSIATVLTGVTSKLIMGKKEFINLQPIKLPKPEKEGGKYVLAALQEIKITRNISSKALPESAFKPSLGCIWS
ncbi:MAG: hypothetical protein ABSA76_06475 [Bacteroidales bacterium]